MHSGLPICAYTSVRFWCSYASYRNKLWRVLFSLYFHRYYFTLKCLAEFTNKTMWTWNFFLSEGYLLQIISSIYRRYSDYLFCLELVLATHAFRICPFHQNCWINLNKVAHNIHIFFFHFCRCYNDISFSIVDIGNIFLLSSPSFFLSFLLSFLLPFISSFFPPPFFSFV